MLLQLPALARAQGGPPFLTNDPGTPGDANWEINLGSMQSFVRGASSYQVPQLDINLGLGDRIQLTYEIPYGLQTSAGEPSRLGQCILRREMALSGPGTTGLAAVDFSSD